MGLILRNGSNFYSEHRILRDFLVYLVDLIRLLCLGFVSIRGSLMVTSYFLIHLLVSGCRVRLLEIAFVIWLKK